MRRAVKEPDRARPAMLPTLAGLRASALSDARSLRPHAQATAAVDGYYLEDERILEDYRTMAENLLNYNNRFPKAKQLLAQLEQKGVDKKALETFIKEYNMLKRKHDVLAMTYPAHLRAIPAAIIDLQTGGVFRGSSDRKQFASYIEAVAKEVLDETAKMDEFIEKLEKQLGVRN